MMQKFCWTGNSPGFIQGIVIGLDKSMVYDQTNLTLENEKHNIQWDFAIQLKYNQTKL